MKFVLLGVLVMVFASACVAQNVNTSSNSYTALKAVPGNINVNAGYVTYTGYGFDSPSYGCCNQTLNNPPRPISESPARPISCSSTRPISDSPTRPVSKTYCRPL